MSAGSAFCLPDGTVTHLAAVAALRGKGLLMRNLVVRATENQSMTHRKEAIARLLADAAREALVTDGGNLRSLRFALSRWEECEVASSVFEERFEESPPSSRKSRANARSRT